MPRISQRRILIEWFLEGIERDKAHLQNKSSSRFWERQKVISWESVRQLITDRQDVREDDSVSCSVSISNSEPDSSLFSSGCGGVRVDWECNLRGKVVLLRKIEARRYLQDWGGWNLEGKNPQYSKRKLLGRCQLTDFVISFE